MHYIIHILKNNVAIGNSYDIELIISDSDIIPSKYRCCVYRLTKETKRVKKLLELSQYFNYKFYHCMEKSEMKVYLKPTRATILRYIGVRNQLDWIKSIVDVEFDYHFGRRECLKKENKVYLKEYKASKYTGYGPMFCDNNKLTESRLLKFYLK